MSKALEWVNVEPVGHVKRVVIWLHGLGADGYDFEPIVASLNVSESLGMRFIFPHAPIRPVTINGGMKMRAWYDILEMSLNRTVDMANIEQSCEQVLALIDAQIAQGIPSERIVLAGFSQGGVIAYHLGLRCPHRLAGIMALSTYLVVPEQVELAVNNMNGNTPILIQHGAMDQVVPLVLGANAQSRLTQQGYAVTYQTYPMPHSVCPEQVVAISEWLHTVFA